jgi:hypothetical protein
MSDDLGTATVNDAPTAEAACQPTAMAIAQISCAGTPGGQRLAGGQPCGPLAEVGGSCGVRTPTGHRVAHCVWVCPCFVSRRSRLESIATRSVLMRRDPSAQASSCRATTSAFACLQHSPRPLAPPFPGMDEHVACAGRGQLSCQCRIVPSATAPRAARPESSCARRA